MSNKIKIACGIFAVILLASMVYYGRYSRDMGNGGDSWGYYVYLPSTFISQDLTTLKTALDYRNEHFGSSVYKDEEGRPRASEAPYKDGIQSIKYTYGLSLFYAPSFFIAHASAHMLGYKPNGYSAPYVLGLFLSTIFYVLLGLYLLGKTLSRSFDDKVVILTLGTIILASNLYYFSVYNNVMSHPILFFLWSLLLYCTDRFITLKKGIYFLFVAFCVGMITIIRPVEVISLSVPFLYNVSSFEGFKKRLGLIFENWLLVLAGVIVGLACIVPQLIYWYSVSGHLFYDSYPSEGFDFTNPHILKGLFGFMNGWLPYSPAMAFSLIGLIIMIVKKEKNALYFSILVFIYCYVIYSWWNWSYINGFGCRPMVDIYPILAFPLAFFIQGAIKKFFKPLVIVLLAFTALNFFQTYQFANGILWTEMANSGYYLQTFGQTKYSKKMSFAADLNHYQPDHVSVIDTVFVEGFEDIDDDGYIEGRTGKAMRITKDKYSSRKKIVLKYSDLMKSPTPEYLSFVLDIMIKKHGGGYYDYDYMVFKYQRPDGSQYSWRTVKLNNKPGGPEENSLWWGEMHKWDTVTGHLHLSSLFEEGHVILIEFGKTNDASEIYVDNLRLMTSR